MLRIAIPALLFAAFSLSASADEVPRLKAGQPAPDFTMTGIDGKDFKLSDKLKGGDRNIALMFSRANW